MICHKKSDTFEMKGGIKMSVINVPRYYENKIGIIKEAGEQIKKIGKNAFVIGGNTAISIVEKDLYSSLRKNNIDYEVEIFSGYPTQKSIDELSNIIFINKNDVIIGIGGGRVLDLVKAIGDKVNLPVVTIPTIPATCAAWSALSVIYKENGEQDTYINLKNSPELILADKEILAKAPIRYINSGVADTIVKWYEIVPDLNDNKNDFCLRLQLKVCELADEFLREDYINSFRKGELFKNPYLINNAIDSIIMLAGLAGSIKGSIPYGGLAHQFYNNSTKVHETNSLLHGEKVIFGLLVQLELEKKSEDEISGYIEWMQALNLPTTLKELGIDSESIFKVSKIAKGIIDV
ncbi:iron-containing alcohol dehydrogenase family protein [Clostridium algoriphilum]|uniref:iron-containing alcohol dehydrogenase family protein n=1 Tax=Clostridium algoriphilum TaxID=198347 RepID=UPI001CF410A3|nr:iron-containing alcohol dehydrogenase family protein [Clostridium algoriphilum]MCB2294827.1 iron-containing alcohol dehydrogenase family protein [Clostridium algoriphilum]